MTLLPRLFTEKLISPSDLQASDPRLKVVGVFNPGVTEFKSKTSTETIMVARVVEQVIEQREGYQPSPRYDKAGELQIDWLPNDDIDFHDPRVYHIQSTGLQRLRFISYLLVLRSPDGKIFDTSNLNPTNTITFKPETPYESFGIEDPRITRIDDTYYMTYVAVSLHGVTTCLASTTDFKSFKRHGVIFCPENKDVVLFPETINGQFMAMHRPMPTIKFRPPEMWLATSDNLTHWGNHCFLLSGQSDWQSGRIGGGTPPLRDPDTGGWLTVYHGSEKTADGKGVGMYTAGALLLDTNEPQRVIKQTTSPIMQPELDFEKIGFVNNVVFPTAMLDRGEEWWVYYGAADEHIGVTAYRKADLSAALQ